MKNQIKAVGTLSMPSGMTTVKDQDAILLIGLKENDDGKGTAVNLSAIGHFSVANLTYMLMSIHNSLDKNTPLLDGAVVRYMERRGEQIHKEKAVGELN